MPDERLNKKPAEGAFGDYLAALEQLFANYEKLHNDIFAHISVLRAIVSALVLNVLEENGISKAEFVARATASCDNERVAQLIATWINHGVSDKKFDA